MNTENLMPYGKLRQKNQRLNRTGQKKNPGSHKSKNSKSVSEPQKIKYWKKEFDLVELFYSFADAWSPPPHLTTIQSVHAYHYSRILALPHTAPAAIPELSGAVPITAIPLRHCYHQNTPAVRYSIILNKIKRLPPQK